MNDILSYKCLARIFHPFIIDRFPYHVWVGEHQRSVIGDTAEKIDTIVKMVLHPNYSRSTYQNDIGIVNIFL